MRSLDPFAANTDSLIARYTARLAEALAVRRAGMEARAARAEAELSIRARSEFLSNMNHELRTPLNAIIGFATMLRDSETYSPSEDQRRAYAEYILQSADLLLGHINTILETAALDGGTVAIEKAEARLDELLAQAIARAKIAADAAGVTIENRTKDDPALACFCDATRVGQAIDHVLRTALRASPKGQRIFARASLDESGMPEIAIRDKGEGLAPEAIRQALSAFEEVHRGLDRSFAGPGVSLAIAKTFIEMQGGRFRIDSRPGQGVLVRLSLPPRQAQENDLSEPVRLAG
ncbi:MAG: hypothetical protein GC153_11820 [Alphaproteobacteria bacterium]|nr:hypothetical protein [Alphaproteobacteria bacterium]